MTNILKPALRPEESGLKVEQTMSNIKYMFQKFDYERETRNAHGIEGVLIWVYDSKTRGCLKCRLDLLSILEGYHSQRVKSRTGHKSL